jgi:hypothetical protein
VKDLLKGCLPRAATVGTKDLYKGPYPDKDLRVPGNKRIEAVRGKKKDQKDQERVKGEDQGTVPALPVGIPFMGLP